VTTNNISSGVAFSVIVVVVVIMMTVMVKGEVLLFKLELGGMRTF